MNAPLIDRQTDTDQRAGGFAPYPDSWYYIGTVKEISRMPVRLDFPDGKSVVAYRGESGRLAVLSARCSHLGADLSLGKVQGENLVCPLHGWAYGVDGVCAQIPACKSIPDFARQISFPVEERGGQVFFYNQPQERFPLPFFDGVAPAELYAARSFNVIAEVPWALLSANGFDVQHFRCAHDRTLVGEPVVNRLDQLAWRMATKLKVTGSSMSDRLTRYVAGGELTMTVTSWCGNLVLVEAKFPRTTSYGLVSLLPLERNRTLTRVIVWTKRSRGSLGQSLFDPVNAWVHRWFIREFIRPDVEISAGIRYNPNRLIPADQPLANYMDWLQKIHR